MVKNSLKRNSKLLKRVILFILKCLKTLGRALKALRREKRLEQGGKSNHNFIKVKVKVKFTLQATKAQRWSRGIALLFLWPRHAPTALPPGNTRYPSYRRLGGPWAGLDEWGKSRPTPGFDPRTVKPVTSRYTDWAIPARNQNFIDIKRYKLTISLPN
jgi:hypothetical protein